MPRLFDTATLNPPISLDGPWLLAFDPDNVGRKEKWATRVPRHAERTFVPSCWNFHLGRFDYMGAAWYWRRVHLPEAGPDAEDWTFSTDAIVVRCQPPEENPLQKEYRVACFGLRCLPQRVWRAAAKRPESTCLGEAGSGGSLSILAKA